LAIFWSAINGVLSLQTLTIGFIIGYGVLFVARRALGDDRYFRKSYLIISLLLFVALELFKSSLQIVVDILTLKHRMRPGIVKIPLDAKSDLEITLLANLISLTPGTLSLDVSQNRRELFVHVMYLQGDDLEPVRKAIKDNYERKILELLR
jgi:multicomponent Na+:H+ antiporter subunit E